MKHAHEQATASALGISARLRLLTKWAAAPDKAPSFVKAACANQAALAAMDCAAWGIAPMSLNTLKAHAARTAWEDSDGWRALETLRRAIQGRTVGHAAPAAKSGSKEALRCKVSDLERQLDQAQRSRALLMRAYLDLLTLTQQAGSDDDRLAHQLQRHQATFIELGLRPVTS